MEQSAIALKRLRSVNENELEAYGEEELASKEGTDDFAAIRISRIYAELLYPGLFMVWVF